MNSIEFKMDRKADRKVGKPVNTADVPGGGCLLIQAAIIDMDWTKQYIGSWVSVPTIPI